MLNFKEGVFFIGFGGAVLSLAVVVLANIWAGSEISELRTDSRGDLSSAAGVFR